MKPKPLDCQRIKRGLLFVVAKIGNKKTMTEFQFFKLMRAAGKRV